MNSNRASWCIPAAVVWLLASGCASENTTKVVSSDEEVRIAQENFPESRILANILGFLAQSEGFKPLVSNDFGEFSQILERMRMNADSDDRDDWIDVNINYMGDVTDSVIAVSAEEDDPIGIDADENAVKKWLKDEGILMKQLGFENGYELAVRKDFAEILKLETCADLLALKGGPYQIAMTRAFKENEWNRIREYLDPSSDETGESKFEVKILEHEISYDALTKAESVDFMVAYSTDWQLVKDSDYDVTLLTDKNKRCFPRNYVAVLLYRKSFDTDHESLWKQFEYLADEDSPSSSFLSDEAMRTLNSQMNDGEGQNETLVAANYVTKMLRQQGRSWTAWWAAFGGMITLITAMMMRRRFSRQL